jgi:hypothetical protein
MSILIIADFTDDIKSSSVPICFKWISRKGILRLVSEGKTNLFKNIQQRFFPKKQGSTKPTHDVLESFI